MPARTGTASIWWRYNMGDTSVGAPTITSGQLDSLEGQKGLLSDMYRMYQEGDPLIMDRLGLVRNGLSDEQTTRQAEIDAEIAKLTRDNEEYNKLYYNARGDDLKNNVRNIAAINMQTIKKLQEEKKAMKGSLREMNEEERLATMDDTEKSLFLANKERANRQLLASQGKLELPDYIKEQLGSQRDASLESLSRRYGTDYMQTSGGRKAFEDIQKNEASIRDAYARGEETTGMGLLGQGQGMYSNLNQQAIGGYNNYANRGMGLFGAYGQAYQPWQQISQGMYDADYQAKLNRAGAWSGLLGAGGSLVGMYTGSGAISK